MAGLAGGVEFGDIAGGILHVTHGGIFHVTHGGIFHVTHDRLS